MINNNNPSASRENADISFCPENPLRPGGLALTCRMLDFCQFQPNSMVLDAGCGTGASVFYLQHQKTLKISGLDISRQALNQASEKVSGANILQACAEYLPFQSQLFSGIFCECVLSLLREPVKALREFNRVLTGEGYLCLTDLYNRTSGGKLSDQDNHPEKKFTGRLTEAELKLMLKNCGFRVKLWEERSDDLKQFIFQVVFSGTSWDTFQSRFADKICPDGKLTRLTEQKIGYYLLVAQKE